MRIGEPFLITVSGIDTPIAYEWFFDDVALVELNNQPFTLHLEPLLSGVYTISYKAETEDGQSYEKSIDIEITTQKANEDQTILGEKEEEIEETLDPYHELLLNNKKYIHYGLPHFVKRNARYRGHRESEKILNSHQEQVVDIYHNHDDIKYFKKLLDGSIEFWFHGRKGENIIKRVISEEKAFKATSENNKYKLNDDITISGFDNLVVKLNGDTVNPEMYYIEDSHLIINISDIDPSLSEGTLLVSYDAISIIHNDDTIGLYPIINRLRHLEERVMELNRRYMNYENAYK